MNKFVFGLLLGAVTLPRQLPLLAAPIPNVSAAAMRWPTFPSNDVFETGDFSPSVAAIQYLLRGRGYYHGKIDGMFGSRTKRSIIAFQKAKHLRADGVAGPRTLPLLVVNLNPGSRGDAVRAAQILARGAQVSSGMPNLGLEVDGFYGPSTVSAVRKAQECQNGSQKRIKVDGIMGPRSWCLMLGGFVVGEKER